MGKRKYEATQHINGVSPMSNVKTGYATIVKNKVEQESELPLTKMEAYKIMQEKVTKNDGTYYTISDCIKQYNDDESKGRDHLISVLNLLKLL